MLLGISGALRATSTNRYLVRAAARAYGGDYAEADLNLPLYDGDLEAVGIPDAVQVLADQIARAEAVVISTPEYNKALSGVLKNALDWISRTEGNPWLDKPVAIMSAAAGRAGGERAQFSLRLCLVPFRPVIVNAAEILVAKSGEQFDADGTLTNPFHAKQLDSAMALLRGVAQP